MIDAIFIANDANTEQTRVTKADVVTGKGIKGDSRYGKSIEPGTNITFVESEEIASYNRSQNQNIAMDGTRRNVVTQGVRLNGLVGKTFSIGNAKFLGVELCEPCSYLAELLSNDTITKANVVKAFVHKAGLRADVISDGTIALGMRLNIVPR